MRLLYLTDRLSLRGGADQHLLQVLRDALSFGARVRVAYGRAEPDVCLPGEVETVRVKGLASAVSSTARLGALPALLAEADVVHVQNVMNPLPLRQAVETGRAVVTVQDHRVFCPGLGKTLPDGGQCHASMDEGVCCIGCLPDDSYRARMLALTQDRLDALQGARVLVLSRYMARELATAGLTRVEVLPPWVPVSDDPLELGEGFVLGGRLVEHKGGREAWAAWSRAATGHPLLVAGAGPLADSALGDAEMLGWLSNSDLRRLLHGARGLLFPGFWQEPFGILGVEALAEGTPVVVMKTGGVGDWTDAGCLVVPRGDVESMSLAIQRLVEDASEAVALGRAGREMVAERFARGPIVRRLRETYEEAG